MSNPIHIFFIQHEDGQRIEWRNLTRLQAVRLYNLTANNPPDNLHSFGWK